MLLSLCGVCEDAETDTLQSLTLRARALEKCNNEKGGKYYVKLLFNIYT